MNKTNKILRILLKKEKNKSIIFRSSIIFKRYFFLLIYHKIMFMLLCSLITIQFITMNHAANVYAHVDNKLLNKKNKNQKQKNKRNLENKNPKKFLNLVSLDN